VNNVRTVSDTKRTFYTHHTRPVNSIYRRVVEELMVEMHLLSVNIDFVESPIYDLGVVTTFDRFMQGYLPEADKDSIFAALCQAVQGSAPAYRQRAEAIKATVNGLSLDQLKAQFEAAKSSADSPLQQALHAVAINDKFKYSRLFAIGLYTLVEAVDEAVLSEKDSRNTLMMFLADCLNISGDKVIKDLELYRSNLDKMAQAQEVMQDILNAERKKREQRAQAASTTEGDTADQDQAASAEPETTETAEQS
jgi:photosystem II biogenesis protein Psp29